MNGKRSNNWKKILTGWMFAVLFFGAINVLPPASLQTPKGTAVQTAEGQEGSEDEPGIQLYCEIEEEWPLRN